MALLNPVTDFGLNLLNQTSSSESIVLSALSISMALALVHAGAGGKTKDQIREAMAEGGTVNPFEGTVTSGFTDNQLINYYKEIGSTITRSEKVKLLVANRMYIKEGFDVKKTYLDMISKNYQAKTVILDFDEGKKSADQVNGFVKEVTHDMIKDLVKESTFKGLFAKFIEKYYRFPDAVALLINAIYLDAKWAVPFTSSMTQEGDFYTSAGQIKKVKYLRDIMVTRPYGETDEAEILTLKYQDNDFTFSIILPKERFGLAKLRAGLTGEKLQKMLGSVKNNYINVSYNILVQK